MTDKQKKKIIADYTINQNYSETARINKVTDTTVRRLIKNNQDVLKKVEEKKEENTLDILEYMDSIANEQKEVIDLTLKKMKQKLTRPRSVDMNIKDLGTTYGIMYDKALKSKELKLRSAELNKNKRDIEDLTVLADMLGFGDNQRKQ